MKKILLLVSLAFWFATITTESVRADVYASNVRITQDINENPFDGSFADGSGLAVRFILNDFADSVIVKITPAVGGAAVKTLVGQNFTASDNTLNWDGTTDAGDLAAAGNYVFEVTAYSNGYSVWTNFFDSGGIGIFTRGVDVNRDPSSRNFGFMYAGNSGGPLGFGILRMAADGSPAGGDTLGGYVIPQTLTFGFTSNNMFHATLDDLGRTYVTGTNTGLNVVRLNADNTLTPVITGLKKPRGLYIKGTGAQRTIYIADDSSVVRATIGDDSVFTGTRDTVALLGTLVKDLIIDDSGFLYVNLRSGSGVDGTSAGGISTEKYNISGTLPVTRNDSLWSVPWTGSRPVGLGINRGTNLASNADDKLYVSASEGNYGVFEITGISGTSPTATKIFDPPLGAISSRADLTVDVIGNVIFFENSNEHVYFLSPPTGPNNYTTNGLDTVSVATPGRVFALLSIAVATEDLDGNFVPDRAGDTLRVIGVVNSVNFQTTNVSYGVQDATSGVTLFHSGQTSPPLTFGDLVQIQGYIQQFNGLTEITPTNPATNVVVLDSNQTVDAVVLTIGELLADGEKYESMRIKLTVAAALFTAADWPASGSKNLNIWDGYDTMVMRIDSDTEIDGSTMPTFPVELFGTLTQFSTAIPPNTGYQLQPSFLTDFVPTTTTPLSNFDMISPTDGASVVLNDSSQTVDFSWHKAIDLDGDALIYQWVPIGFTSRLSNNGGADSVLTLTGTDLLSFLGAADTVTFNWTVKAKDPAHPAVDSRDSSTVTIIRGTITGIAEDASIPTDYYLHQNYPNPFNPSTTINYGLPTAVRVRLDVYNILGQKVATLVDEEQQAGRYSILFRADRYASGAYFYVLMAGDRVLKNKMLLLK